MSPHVTKNSNSTITAVILSGGAGQRFGGLDKGLELYKGRPLIEHAIERLSDQVDNIVLCVNRNQEQYQAYGYPLIYDANRHMHTGDGLSTKPHLQDQQPANNISVSSHENSQQNFQGPLAGITAAMSYLSTASCELNKPGPDFGDNHYLLVSPCDSPNLPRDHAAKLIAAMRDNGNSCAVVNDGIRKQNLHCVIATPAWASLQSFYDNGGRAMHRWHKKNGSINVNFVDQAACFTNVNSADMLT